MTPLKLSEYGVAEAVPLDGNITIKDGWTCPALVLIHERHTHADGIRQSLRNACRLIDTGLVKVVGVESVDKEAEDIPEDVAEDARRFAVGRGFANLQAYLAARTDEQILADSTVVAGGHEMIHFATALKCLRPDALVVSVDDREAFAALQSEQWERDATRPLRARDVAKLKGISLEAATAAVSETDKEYIRILPAQYARDRSFWEKLLARWEQVGLQGIAILNAGTQHQQRVPALVGNKVSIIHLRPKGL